MAEQLLQARICSKYDTYENWSNMNTTGRGGNLVLKQGEIGVCFVPNEADPASPTFLFKIGDGSTIFANLPWGSGLSADVYDWAKAETKPKYTAAEVGALPANTVIPTVPTALKNPNALTFTGAVTGSYDGSSAKTVNIPAAVTVDTALSSTSTNAVQNKAVKTAIDGKADENTISYSWYSQNYVNRASTNNLQDIIGPLYDDSNIRLRGGLEGSQITYIDGGNAGSGGSGDYPTPAFFHDLSNADHSKVIFLFLRDKDSDMTYRLGLCHASGSIVLFSGVDEYNNPISVTGIPASSTTWSSWTFNKYAKAPNATTSDNNKFLRIVNGSPTWVSLTNVAEEGA